MPARLLDEIERLSRRREPIAEINRLAGAEAARMGLPRPSYEQVRVLVHTARRYRRFGPKSWSTIAAENAYYLKPEYILLPDLFDRSRQRLRDHAPPSK